MEYDELVELARRCARNAHLATSGDVAQALWRMPKNIGPRRAPSERRRTSVSHPADSGYPGARSQAAADGTVHVEASLEHRGRDRRPWR
jgi:hypothetical protein